MTTSQQGFGTQQGGLSTAFNDLLYLYQVTTSYRLACEDTNADMSLQHHFYSHITQDSLSTPQLHKYNPPCQPTPREPSQHRHQCGHPHHEFPSLVMSRSGT